MKVEPLIEGKTLPLLINQPANLSLGQTAEWIKTHRVSLDSLARQAGVLVLRHVPMDTPVDFQLICQGFRPELKKYVGGDSPRTALAEFVYTSTEYGSELEVLLHNELSYAGWSPDWVFFGSLEPAETGGETQVADGREIYRKLDSNIRQCFEEKGVIYLQHLRDNSTPGPGKSWQETFETEACSDTEDYLRRSGMDFEWTSLGIRTTARHPAIIEHPLTGDKCWHNQADQWHRLIPSVKDSVGDSAEPGHASSGTEALGNHVIFGDGSEINPQDLIRVREVSRSCEAVFRWKKGDVMIIDNIMAMHGRKPFSGRRQTVVAMA